MKDIQPGNIGSSPHDLSNVNGILFFAADEGTLGSELWRSDGTAAGTSLVKDIQTGSSGSIPHDLINLNGTLYFSAADGSTGSELWRSNGTESGTNLVFDINPESGGSDPFYKTNINGKLFFAANDGSHGQELWLLPMAVNVCQTVQTGDWDSATIWSCGHIPTQTDQVIIGHSITLSITNAQARRVSYNGGKIRFTSSTAKLFIKGDQ